MRVHDTHMCVYSCDSCGRLFFTIFHRGARKIAREKCRDVVALIHHICILDVV